MSKKCYHEEKGVNFNDLHNVKPDPDGCTCDVGATGPAAVKVDENKKTGNCYHNHKGVDFNDLHGAKPDPDGCTCDVGATGPAAVK